MTEERLKETIKLAIIEVFTERPDLLASVVEQVIEDIGLIRAIEEGVESEEVSEEEVFRTLARKKS